MSFSATDAAFEGFRIVRRNPIAIVAWSLVYLVVSLANVFAAPGGAKAMAELTAMMEAMEASPPTTLEGFMPIVSAYGDMMGQMAWLVPLSLIVGAILAAAVARAILTPEANRRFGYVRLGMDEVRVFVVTLAIVIMLCLAMAAAFVLAAVLGGLAIAAMEGWGILVMVLLFLAATALLIWLTVRWSLAVPITVAEKRFAIFDSFGMTKGRFWPLLGMAIIAGVMAMIIALLSMIAVLPLTMISGANMMAAGADPTAMLEAYNPANPWMLATAVVNAIINALMVGVVYAPFSAAYLAFSGKPAPDHQAA